MKRGNGFEKDRARAIAGGKKSKRKGIEQRMQEFLQESIKDGDKRTREDILRDALLKFALKGNVRAIEILMDRAYGKAKQTIEQDTKITTTQPIKIEFED
jgi:transcriptional regulator with AAA-type ATPase domain